MLETKKYLKELGKRRYVDGAYALHDDGQIRPDATSWAILASRMHAHDLDSLKDSRDSLVGFQNSDGSISMSSKHIECNWPTQLGILAWAGSEAHRKNIESAARFLETNRSVSYLNHEITGHDDSLEGWAWVEGTAAWLIPTACAVLALEASGEVMDQAIGRGVDILIDRQLPKGGWNYGNTTVFNRELLPMPESTGIALAALAGRTSYEKISRSIDYAESQLSKTRSPNSLGWLILGLSAWNHRPETAAEMIHECLDRQKVLGAYHTLELGVILCALSETSQLPGIRKI